jgi:hypothetical protein
MAHLSLEVPAALVAPLRESLVLLYHATAESLHLALRAHVERGASLDGIHEHRARLAELDAMLDRMGWRTGRPRADLEVGGPADLLHDAVYGALIDAGERLATALTSAWRGEHPVDDVRVTAREVIALDRLMGRIDDRDPGQGASAGA